MHLNFSWVGNYLALTEIDDGRDCCCRLDLFFLQRRCLAFLVQEALALND